MRITAMIFALGVTLASPVKADSFRRFNNYCTTGSFVSCASVFISVRTLSNGAKALQIGVRNLQGTHPSDTSGGSLINRFDIFFHGVELADWSGQGASTDFEDVNLLGNTPEYAWDSQEGSNFISLYLVQMNIGGITGCDALPESPSEDEFGVFQTCPGQGAPGTVVFNFNSNGNPVEWDINNIDFQWSITGPNGERAFCTVDVDCFPVTATPEPVTMTLVATGLIGIGALRRRRKEQKSLGESV